MKIAYNHLLIIKKLNIVNILRKVVGVYSILVKIFINIKVVVICLVVIIKY